MGIRYTKKEEEQKPQENTLSAEEFFRRVISMNKNPEKLKEIPKTDSEFFMTCPTHFHLWIMYWNSVF